jgi:type II secretory pathway pseudopilin PulG
MEMVLVQHNDLRQRSRPGFSLVEVLLAMTLIMIIAVGIFPLFTQSSVSNLSGNDSTKVSNFARARAEEMFQLPFNATDLTLLAGNELLVPPTDEYYSAADELWKVGPAPATDPALFVRRTTIRQYNVDALTDGQVQVAEALPSTAEPSAIHLKEIQVDITGTRTFGSPLGPAKRISVRLFKSQ